MIGLIGLNHKSAPIEVRERFVFCEEDIKRFIPLLKDKGVQGALVLSTCNRTEIYFETDENDQSLIFSTVKDTLFTYRNVNEDVSSHFYHKSNTDLVRHLFRVVSGLDSMALGEYQIVGQIKNAYSISEVNKFFSCVLFRLFNKAFEMGKKIRTETCINHGAVSISYAGVELAGKKLHNLNSHPVLLIGAGQTSELTLLNLIKKDCSRFTIVNRTYEKAVELAEKYDGKAEEFEKLEELLLVNDIIISSTASKKAIFTECIVQNAMKKRNGTPLLFIDLSVPRNVAHEVGQIENVHVYDIDALNEVIIDNIEKRQDKIIQAEEIILKGVAEFMDWLCTRNLTPAIQKISNRFKKINITEFEGFKRNTPSDYEKISEYGEIVTNKLIQMMVKNVISVTDNGRKLEYVNLVNKLFEQN
ncbi:MAG: glutamyl-tRNA reductase [Bacteroidota bacterium]